MSLRPYQIEAIESVIENKDGPSRRGVIAMATGLGKGHIMPDLIDALGTDKVLYLAHRDTLIGQIKKHLERGKGYGRVGVEIGSTSTGAYHPTVVASVPTLGRKGTRRFEQIKPERFEAVVIDECHHATASSYIRILHRMGIVSGAWDKSGRLMDVKKPAKCPIPLVGLTATPSRGDNVGLGNVFDAIWFEMSIRQGITDGWLVPIVGWTVQSGSNISDVGISKGDYRINELAAAVDTTERNDAIYKACEEHAKGLKSLIFAVNVQHAADIAEYFKSKGRPAMVIHGEMNDDERAHVFRWYEKTPGAVLTNCQLITEGVDIPDIECVVIARPTRSRTLYAQMVGRGTRLAPGCYDYSESLQKGKSECVLIDISDEQGNTAKRAMTMGDLMGSPLPNKRFTGQKLLEAVEEHEKEAEDAKESLTQNVDAVIQSSSLDIFSNSPEVPPEANMDWTPLGDTLYLSMVNKVAVRTMECRLGKWRWEMRDPKTRIWHRMNASFDDSSEAVTRIERFLRKHYPVESRVASKNARWRNNPPSEKQVALAKRLRLEVGGHRFYPQRKAVPEDLTASDFTEAITRRIGN